jgi:hypothetical protein
MRKAAKKRTTANPPRHRESSLNPGRYVEKAAIGRNRFVALLRRRDHRGADKSHRLAAAFGTRAALASAVLQKRIPRGDTSKF